MIEDLRDLEPEMDRAIACCIETDREGEESMSFRSAFSAVLDNRPRFVEVAVFLGAVGMTPLSVAADKSLIFMAMVIPETFT